MVNLGVVSVPLSSVAGQLTDADWNFKVSGKSGSHRERYATNPSMHIPMLNGRPFTRSVYENIQSPHGFTNYADYEAQLPYQEQNDNAANEWIRKRMADRFVGTLGITDWTNLQQRQNFWDLAGYTALGALGVMGGATLYPILAPVSLGGLPMQASLAAGLGMAADIGVGTMLGKAIDWGLKGVTGRDWGQNINHLLGIDENSLFGHITNPGYYSAGKINKNLGERLRWAFYDNIAPYDYYNERHVDEFVRMFKDFFNPKFNARIKELKAGADPKQVSQDRDAATRLSLGFPQRSTSPTFGASLETYGMNENGTLGYRFDNDRLDVFPRSERTTEKIILKDGNRHSVEDVLDVAKMKGEPISGTGYDNITGAGGNTGTTVFPDGTVRMGDIWDLHPGRTPIAKAITKLSGIPVKPSSLPKFLDKLEVVSLLGGSPINVQQFGKIDGSGVVWKSALPYLVRPQVGKISRWMPYDATWFSPIGAYKSMDSDD